MRLLKNEWCKMFAKKSTWLMLVIEPLIILVVALVGRLAAHEAHAPRVEANDLLQTLGSGLLPSLVSLFVVVVMAASVAEEFSYGTINSLLTQAHSRLGILNAKFAACLGYAFVVNAMAILSSWLVGSLVLGFQSPLRTALGFPHHLTVLEVAIGIAVSNWIMDCLYGAVTFFISVAIHSEGIAIAVGLGTLFMNTLVNSFFLMLMERPHWYWLKWLPFNLFNLRSKFQFIGAGVHLDPWDLSYPQMVGAILVYSTFFYLLSLWIFRRQDIVA